jgi:hypothetical protein
VSNTNKKVILQAGNLVGVIVTVIVNVLASIGLINGISTGAISDKYMNLFVPSGLTFSIWSIIYILLFAFAIYQAKDLFKKEKEDLPFLDQINYLFIIASAANIIWIFVWQYEIIIASVVMMLVLLVSLIAIYLRLNIGRAAVSRKVKIYIHLPFSVYLGWITVATIANITALLVPPSLSWDGFGIAPDIWTILVIIVAGIITGAMLLTRKDIAYSLVVIWALLGIVTKRINDYMDIVLAASITAIVIGVVILLVLIKNRKK